MDEVTWTCNKCGEWDTAGHMYEAGFVECQDCGEVLCNKCAEGLCVCATAPLAEDGDAGHHGTTIMSGIDINDNGEIYIDGAWIPPVNVISVTENAHGAVVLYRETSCGHLTIKSNSWEGDFEMRVIPAFEGVTDDLTGTRWMVTSIIKDTDFWKSVINAPHFKGNLCHPWDNEVNPRPQWVSETRGVIEGLSWSKAAIEAEKASRIYDVAEYLRLRLHALTEAFQN